MLTHLEMGSAWEMSGVLATVWSTLDLGTSDPVTLSLIWVLASNGFFSNKYILALECYFVYSCPAHTML